MAVAPAVAAVVKLRVDRITADTLEIVWEKSQDQNDRYNIYWKQPSDPNYQEAKNILCSPERFTCTQLQPDTVYEIKVVTLLGGVEQPDSSKTIYERTTGRVLHEVTGLKVSSRTHSTLTVEWDDRNADTRNKYKVYCHQGDQQKHESKKPIPGTAKKYKCTGLMEDTVYKITVETKSPGCVTVRSITDGTTTSPPGYGYEFDEGLNENVYVCCYGCDECASRVNCDGWRCFQRRKDEDETVVTFKAAEVNSFLALYDSPKNARTERLINELRAETNNPHVNVDALKRVFNEKLNAYSEVEARERDPQNREGGAMNSFLENVDIQTNGRSKNGFSTVKSATSNLLNLTLLELSIFAIRGLIENGKGAEPFYDALLVLYSVLIVLQGLTFLGLSYVIANDLRGVDNRDACLHRLNNITSVIAAILLLLHTTASSLRANGTAAGNVNATVT